MRGKKFRYQGGITKMICSKIAKRGREEFSKYIHGSGKINIVQRKTVLDIDILSFSSKRDFEEQVFSIMSFLRYAGKPTRWIIYSDDSHISWHHQFIKDHFDFVSIEKWNACENKYTGFEDVMASYMKFNILAKRLYAYANHPVERMTMFMDSDVLFYEKIAEKLDIVLRGGGQWYLPDAVWGTLDSTYKSDHTPDMFQLNGGCFVTDKFLDWNPVFEYMQSLKGTYEYFSDQTAFHIAFMKQGAKPLDPRYFILNCEDQFDFGYKYFPEEIALRHYVHPIRHKMWQKNWKWHLKI